MSFYPCRGSGVNSITLKHIQTITTAKDAASTTVSDLDKGCYLIVFVNTNSQENRLSFGASVKSNREIFLTHWGIGLHECYGLYLIEHNGGDLTIIHGKSSSILTNIDIVMASGARTIEKLLVMRKVSGIGNSTKLEALSKGSYYVLATGLQMGSNNFKVDNGEIKDRYFTYKSTGTSQGSGSFGIQIGKVHTDGGNMTVTLTGNSSYGNVIFVYPAVQNI